MNLHLYVNVRLWIRMYESAIYEFASMNLLYELISYVWQFVGFIFMIQAMVFRWYYLSQESLWTTIQVRDRTSLSLCSSHESSYKLFFASQKHKDLLSCRSSSMTIFKIKSSQWLFAKQEFSSDYPPNKSLVMTII